MASIYKGLLALRQLSCLWLLLVWALCLNHCTLPVGMAQQLIPSKDLANNETGICKSVDIRNSIKAFESLVGCRVVEGFVQILLFDTVEPLQFANLSFPLLTEITDYLLLYRVSGLLSLGQLFPNLVVIRGYSLLFGYAFIIFEMPNLQEINLYSLTDIMRGSIRIDKNPSLCFVYTIDWKLIAHDHNGHFIRSIKSENECPLCPGDDSDQPCPLTEDRNRRLCWNTEHCQKVCRNCLGRACDEKGRCCDEKCLGGCVNDKNNCTVCKNFTMIHNNQRKCLSHCPDTHLEYLNRKCVTAKECTSFRDNRVQQDFPYRIYNKSCVMECPKDYMDDTRNKTCVPCDGKCTKICPGRIVDGVSSIRELGGCTHINGSLEIQIRGGQNIVHELEENLKLISVIDGYLKIVRSFPLISLSFFKNLAIIRGNVLENNRYVISLLDNQNLQDIWDWTNRTLRVDKGRLFFHFNPKLCIEKIDMLQMKTKLPKYEEHEVSAATNGDKIACKVEIFTVNVTNIESSNVELRWRKYEMVDPRKLLAFLIYHIEAPYPNVTLYDNRDACGDYGWNVIEVSIPENYSNISHMSRVLTGLKPYTQYAFYITTYTIAAEKRGAQSKIQYFRTDAAQPSVPRNFQIESNSSDSLLITWDRPIDPNGNITHYSINITKLIETEFVSISKQDHCNRDIPVPPRSSDDTSPAVPPKPNDTCVCRSKQKPKLFIKESERSSQISFEDELLNKVYVRRPKPDNKTRKKRELDLDMLDDEPVANTTEISAVNSTSKENVTYDNISFQTEGLKLYVRNLRHYTEYSVILQACRGSVPGNKEKECSSEDYWNKYRTLPKEGADNITSGVTIEDKNLTSVTLKWDPPEHPNGFILYYRIEYSRLDIDNQPYTRCINHLDFKNNSYRYTLIGLNAGNHSVKVQAVSQAKIPSAFTSPVYFVIEESSNNDFWIIFGSLVIFLASVLLLLYIYKRHRQKHFDNKLITTVNPDYVSTYEPDEWEVPRKKIELHKELGQGSFGMVYEGIARDIRGKAQVRCAIKTVNEHATNRERIEFLNEASVMKAFDTTHVVKLLGVVSQGQPTLVVMELMANGDLKSYLRSHRPESDNYSLNIIRQPPTLKRILQMAIEIADGMAYLSAKKFVHRDLAARNCMVSEDLTVKIGDFGMTRDIYETDYYRKGTKGLLPVRWMAPESLKDGVFSSSSDIWSYGVVLWEMATLASQPYQGLSNDQVLRYVIDGGIMERPENCPDKLYMLMMYCWKHKYTERPSFLELCSLLLEDASPSFSKVSFYHSAAGMEARASRNNHLLSQDDPSTPLRLTSDLDGNYLDSSGPESEQDDDLVGNTHLEFSSYPVQKDSSATVNGYLGTNASNGTTA